MGQRFHSESSNTRPVDIVIAEHCGDFQIFTSPELQPDTHTQGPKKKGTVLISHMIRFKYLYFKSLPSDIYNCLCLTNH
jgi:hypothetical protein